MSKLNGKLAEQLSDAKSEVLELREALEAIRTESQIDPVTTLVNRMFFDTALADSLRHAQRTGDCLSLLMTDIDHFKKFNDTFGHLTGDQVLRLVAVSIKQNVKGLDTAARFGGEEFAIILPGCDLSGATQVAEQVRKAVQARELVKRSTGENLGRVTISIGVATFRKEDTPTTILERADNALYAAKRGGGTWSSRRRIPPPTSAPTRRRPEARGLPAFRTGFSHTTRRRRTELAKSQNLLPARRRGACRGMDISSSAQAKAAPAAWIAHSAE